MNFRTKHSRLAAAAVGALAACTLGISATPASAAASDGYIRGAGSIYDDFGDEGTLSISTYANSNLACFWQQVLYAEGARESDESNFDRSDIDGNFGSNTRFATRTLQYRWGLDADGLVGNGTFGKLDAKREYTDVDGGTWVGKLQYVSTMDDGDIKAKYHGKLYSFDMYRSAETGRWSFRGLGADELDSIMQIRYTGENQC
ncbi:Tat pathway signal protein [Streptomyces sp. YC504]|uniref:Tat pathway signal protein n=1 Tax=Streptomyces mesophilus TaxID=1775132 RepID=A0A6G4XXD2_9ACTN|nr:peptidoglycan-binding domain-containing protein [Streptomyces mesophilus]NGO81261.1 Tat pathway signal protein [Streptomyces mesophilus]